MDELQKILKEMNSDLLTEDTVTKISDLFEAVVSKKTLEIKKEFKEEYEGKVSKLDEEFKTFVEKETAVLEDKAVSYVDDVLFEKFNEYVNHVAEEYVEENKLVISDGLKSEMFEGMVSGLKNLLAENSIAETEIDAGKYEEKITALKESLEDKEKKLIEQKNELQKKVVLEVFGKVANGLTDIQVKQLKEITEDYSVSNIEEFERKLFTAKELVIKESKKSKSNDPDYSGGEIEGNEPNGLDLFKENEDEKLYDKIIDRF